MAVRRIAAAVLSAALLSACSDGTPDPEGAPTPTASAPPSPTPTESESIDPSPEPEAQEEFIRRWFELYMSMQKSGDAADFLALSDGCEACKSTADRYRDIYASGGEITGGKITVTSTRRLGRNGRQETWIAAVSVTPTKYRESAADDVQRLPGGDGAFRLVIARWAGSYVVNELYQEST